MKRYDLIISRIRKLKDFSDRRSRVERARLIKEVNIHIGGLRLTAFKNKGTTVSKICYRESSRLESLLKMQ